MQPTLRRRHRSRPKLEVADVFRRYGAAYREKFGASLSSAQRRVMSRAIESSRAAVLGGHVEVCDRCGQQRIWFNSCSDRHCPKCQSLARAQWIEERQSEILKTEYFHVVFTVSEEIADIALQNKRTVYGILFRATAETLRTMRKSVSSPFLVLGFEGSCGNCWSYEKQKTVFPQLLEPDKTPGSQFPQARRQSTSTNDLC